MYHNERPLPLELSPSIACLSLNLTGAHKSAWVDAPPVAESAAASVASGSALSIESCAMGATAGAAFSWGGSVTEPLKLKGSLAGGVQVSSLQAMERTVPPI